MYYRDLFTPLLSHAAHVRGNRDAPQAVARNVLRMVVAALEQARLERPEYLDEAWFPVCEWLDEQLADTWRIVAKNAPLRQRYFHGEMADWEFYSRLDTLLSKNLSSGVYRDIASLYSSCLALGYQGRLDEAGKKEERKRYLRQCRKLLTARYARPPVAERPRLKIGSAVATALVYAVPAASTIALYFTYKYYLSDWFSHVVRQ